ncbi:hypothetical protein E4U30_007579 [Claviceps sp. LM220 group G6]|nr:hypothetical protein E4U30_007579 [Claviceps sp. LM220 group G6]
MGRVRLFQSKLSQSITNFGNRSNRKVPSNHFKKCPTRIQMRSNSRQSASFFTIDDTPVDDDGIANTIVGSKRDVSDAPDSAPSVKRSKQSRVDRTYNLEHIRRPLSPEKVIPPSMGRLNRLATPEKALAPRLNRNVQRVGSSDHDLRGYWYVNEEQRPDWWTPHPQIQGMIEHRQEVDPNFRRLVSDAKNEL